MTRELQSFRLWFHLEGVVGVRQVLVDAGFAPPSWDDLARGLKPLPLLDDDDPTTPKHGWQYLASQRVNTHFFGATVWPRLPNASRALLRSQSGPLASASFTCCLTAPPPLTLSAVFAGDAVHSILVATTAQHVLWRGCSGVVGSQWSQQQHECVAKGWTGHEQHQDQDMDIVARNGQALVPWGVDGGGHHTGLRVAS